jgi:D-psicose/D-tagatose/L-ribulose 3-epimerase
MPKYGAHAFLWIDTWTVEKGNHAIAEAGKHGFDFIEIPLLRPDEFEAAAHKKALADAGIGATASLTLPDEAHMPAAPEKAKVFLMSALDKVEATGLTYLCGCTAYTLGRFTNEPPTEEEIQIIVDTLGEVAEVAKSRGIRLGLESVNRYESYLCNTLGDTREVILATGSDNLDLHADTYHMNIEENGFYNAIVDAADVLSYIHMSESHRGLVGTGTVIWDDIFRGLKDANYAGPLVLESFAAINPDLLAATKLWRAPSVSSDVLAGEGLKFLKAGAEKVGL